MALLWISHVLYTHCSNIQGIHSTRHIIHKENILTGLSTCVVLSPRISNILYQTRRNWKQEKSSSHVLSVNAHSFCLCTPHYVDNKNWYARRVCKYLQNFRATRYFFILDLLDWTRSIWSWWRSCGGTNERTCFDTFIVG